MYRIRMSDASVSLLLAGRFSPAREALTVLKAGLAGGPISPGVLAELPFRA
jgi:hypothetical protein